MEYGIENIEKIKIGDVLVLDIDSDTGSFPNEYADAIKLKNDELNANMAAYVYSKELKIRLLFKDKNFKTIGIVVDNYKLEKMKSELFKKDFLLLEISAFNKNTTSITFPVPADQFEKKKREILAITNIVEIHFKRRN